MPIDVVKTRLQMDGSGGVKVYNGSVDCAKKLVGAEGPSARLLSLTVFSHSLYKNKRDWEIHGNAV